MCFDLMKRLEKTRYRLNSILVLLLVLCMPLVTSAQENAPPGLTIHVVQRGENLFRIGLRYGVSVDDLARLNGIANPASIQVGQRLLVPSAPGALPTNAQTHNVQPGETLATIAERYGLTPEALSAANANLGDSDLFIGQTLIIPASVSPATAASSAHTGDLGLLTAGDTQAVFHVVLRGETLFQIATQYGITVNALVSANAIGDPSLIYPGQQLLIPGIQPPALSLNLPPAVRRIGVQPQVFVTGHTGVVHIQTQQAATITGSFLGMPLTASADAGAVDHYLLVGIPMDAPAGVTSMELTIDAGGVRSTLALNIQVVASAARTESIAIPADRLALIGNEVDAAENEQVRQIMSGYSAIRSFAGPMGLPAAAPITSPFGSNRSYNGGSLVRLHTGTDFAGAPGTPISAAAAGRVVFSGWLDVRGLATIIDHGWGVFTGYWHQTESYVTPGAQVTSGQVIGTIGSSGRVTGPHLHWELWVSGVPVDPMQWVQAVFVP